MTTILCQCRHEALLRVSKGIAVVIAETKQIHGANDPDLARHIVAALIDAIYRETEHNKDLFNRTVEVLACYGRD